MLRSRLPTVALCAFAATASMPPAQAQYDYRGGSRGGGLGEGGFFLELEAAATNPRNADNVVATDIGSSAIVPVIPSWDADFSGRIGLGWGWDSGRKVMASYEQFQTETDSAGSGSFALAIGPPLSDGADFFGDIGGFFSATTEIEATTADVAFGVEHEMAEHFEFLWTLGLRYALFEETQRAVYDEAPAPIGLDSFSARKSNEGEMVGGRVGLRGRYRFGSLSVGGGLALAFLDGELTGQSRLAATGSANSGLSPNAAAVVDDGRSGRITDLDLRLTWHHSSEAVQVWAGWEESVWEEIAADLVRNFPGTVAPLRARDSVTFSGYKLGVQVRF